MFSEYLEEIRRTRSPNTYENYCNALKKFKTGSKEEIIDFIADDSIAGTSKKMYLTVLKSALDYYGALTKDKARIIKGYRCNNPIEPCPTDEEVEKIWGVLKRPRDKLIFALMAYNGLRISEVANLHLGDILSGNKILLRNTKGKQDAVVPIIHDRVRESLNEYLDTRKYDLDELFVTQQRSAMTLEGMKFMVRKVCRECGLPYHPHSFRRYFANTLSKHGVELQYIQTAMRHKNPGTTMRYLNIDQDDVAAIMKRIYKEEAHDEH